MVESKKYRLFYWLIFACSIFTLFIHNNSLGFWDQDESAYAGFAYNFLQTGNWLIPDFLWSDVHRKPPLHFWHIALSFKVFGANEFATRVPSVLAVIGTVLLIRFMSAPLFGVRVSKKAMLILSTSLLLIVLAKNSVTDSTLLFFETLAVLSIFNFLRSKRKVYLLFFILGIAGGALTKGPPVLIITYGILGILFLFRTYRIQTIYLFLVSLLGLIPLFLWGKAVWSLDGGTFITWMIDWYILKRGEGVFGQTGPPGYFLIVFLVGLFAFSSFFLVGLKEHLISFFVKRKRSENSIFIVAWLIAGWFVYELINSKLPAYAIGALPAISLVIADQIEHFRTRLASNTRWYSVTAVIQLVITLAIGGAFIFIAFYFLDGLAHVASIITGLLTIGFGIYLFKNERKDFLLLCMSALIPSFFAWTFIVGSFEEDRCTTKTVAQVVADNYKLSSQVVFTKDFSLPSLPFYLAVKGFDFVENQDFETYNVHLNNGDVLIFDQEGFNLFREQQNELFEQQLTLHQVDGWIPDRGKRISYIIVSRDN